MAALSAMTAESHHGSMSSRLTRHGFPQIWPGRRIRRSVPLRRDRVRTRVDLKHTKLDAHGDRWERYRDMVGNDEGWQVGLNAFAKAAAAWWANELRGRGGDPPRPPRAYAIQPSSTVVI